MNSLLAALINGTILSGVAAAVLWAALRLAPRRVLNAATRYVAWWAALIVAAVFPALFLAGSSRPAPAALTAIQTSPPAASAEAVEGSGLASGGEQEADLPRRGAAAASTEMMAEPGLASGRQVGGVSAPRFPVEIPAGEWTHWLAIVWLAASAAMLIRLALSWLSLQRMSARASDPPAAFGELADRWLARCGSRRRGVRLASSTEIGIPAAVGPLRPSILFPARLFEEMDERALEQIGLHEAAHLARYDDCAVCAQRVLEALLALHPVARWIGRRIDLEREIACDDFVLAATGQSRGYAACLTRMVELSRGKRPSPAMAAAVGRSQLARRVETLLDRTRHAGTRLLRARLAAVVVALALLAWMGGRSPGLLAFVAPPGLPAALTRIPGLAAAALAQTQIISIPDPARPAANAPPSQAPATAVRPEDLCTFGGKVTNAATGEPVGKVTILIRSQGAAPAGRRAYRTATDETGKYEAKGVDPGQYQVYAENSRFVGFSYWPSAARVLTLTAGQKAVGIDLTMMPRGIIEGRVVNRNGGPMAGYYVTPLVFKYVGGRRVMVEAQGSSMTNDAGEYRYAGLPPARYYIQVAAARSSSAGDAEQDRSAKPRQEDYVTSYYPGTADPTAATPVEVAAGQTVNGVDIAVVKSRVTRVSGRIVNQTGVPAGSMMVALTPSGIAGVIGMNATAGPQGEFEFRGVPPGPYTIDVRLLLQTRRLCFMRQAITVGQVPVDNLSILVPGAYEISGAVRVEGDKKLDLRSLKVGLRTPWRQIFGFTVNPAAPEENGAFRLSEINPERYVLEIQNLPEEFYVKSARFGDVDALENGIDLTGGAPAPLQIVLAGPAAGIVGSVKDGDGAAVAEATVALVPQEVGRQRQPLFYRSSKTDPSGNFKMTGLIPGEYKVYAWTRVDGEPWVSAEFLKPLESKGKSVTLRDGGSQMVELRVIPAEQ
jgi:beta-lactamase regulating signal transducer with metallopeptidase domain